MQLIDCVDAEHPNLAIAALRPASVGVRAAAVPLKMEVAVTNYGPQTARDVSVQLAEDGRARPAQSIAKIDPGQTVAAGFEVRYQDAGQHAITAKLPADAVAADNMRYTVLDFPKTVPVLVIDGDPQSLVHKGDAYFVRLMLESSTVAPTGIRPQIEQPRYLREKPLGQFHVIYLLNIDRLQQSEIDALETYLRGGGGVVFFLGERTRADFMNSRLYRDGKGPFPVPLVGPTELLVDRAETASDLTAEADHPVFSLLAKHSGADIDRAIVEHYFAVQKSWKPAENSATKVVVHLRNGAPLVVEGRFGEGRVMAFLTSAAPTWNNLANTPRQVAVMLQLAAYLSAARQIDPSRQVGTPLEIELDRGRYLPQVKFVTPLGGAAGVFPVEAAPSGGHLKAVLPLDTPQAGIYEAQLTTVPEGTVESRRFAYNVVPDEGNLKIVDGPQLAERLTGVKYRFHHAADALFDSDESDRADLGRTMIYVLIAMLLGEQLLAYSASYHAARQAAGR